MTSSSSCSIPTGSWSFAVPLTSTLPWDSSIYLIITSYLSMDVHLAPYLCLVPSLDPDSIQLIVLDLAWCRVKVRRVRGLLAED